MEEAKDQRSAKKPFCEKLGFAIAGGKEEKPQLKNWSDLETAIVKIKEISVTKRETRGQKRKHQLKNLEIMEKKDDETVTGRRSETILSATAKELRKYRNENA